MKLEQETYRHSGKYYCIMYHHHYYLLILVVQVGECLWIHSEVVEDHLPLDSPSLGERIIIMTILLFFCYRFHPPGARYDPVSPFGLQFHPGRGPYRGGGRGQGMYG